MKKALLTAVLLSVFIAVPVQASIGIDVSQSSIQINGPETITISNISIGQSKFWATFQWDPINLNWYITNYGESGGVDNNAMYYAQQLLGNWTLRYTLVTTFTQYYYLDKIDSKQNSQGGYQVLGTGKYGDPVVASYWPDSKHYTLLDPGTIIHKWFVFNISGNNIASDSCYYQVDADDNSFSKCYPLSGSKTALKAHGYADKRLQLPEEEIEFEGVEKALEDPELRDQFEFVRDFILIY
jgi:hypothetical protein